MFNIKSAKYYCKDDISLIENYTQALNDTENKWVIHHRNEITINGEYGLSKNELIRLNMYYKRPYFELIFMRSDEHNNLHFELTKSNKIERFNTLEHLKLANIKTKGSHLTNEHKKLIGEKLLNKPKSNFGEKFLNHYGFGPKENLRLYKTEHNWYKKHNNLCRWE